MATAITVLTANSSPSFWTMDRLTRVHCNTFPASFTIWPLSTRPARWTAAWLTSKRRRLPSTRSAIMPPFSDIVWQVTNGERGRGSQDALHRIHHCGVGFRKKEDVASAPFTRGHVVPNIQGAPVDHLPFELPELPVQWLRPLRAKQQVLARMGPLRELDEIEHKGHFDRLLAGRLRSGGGREHEQTRSGQQPPGQRPACRPMSGHFQNFQRA